MPTLDNINFLLRKNSVVIDIKTVTGGVGIVPADQYSLVKNGLKTKPGQVCEIQFHSVSRNLVVGLEGDEVYQSALQKLEQGITWNKYPGVKIYGWSTSEYLTPVSVQNWSKYLNFDNLKKKIEMYGKIISTQFGFFKEDPKCLNGTVHFRMKLKEGAILPSFVEIEGIGEYLQIVSDNTEKVCFKCTEKGHFATFCRKKPKNVDYTKKSIPTWASITQGGNKSTPIGVVQTRQVVQERTPVQIDLVEGPPVQAGVSQVGDQIDLSQVFSSTPLPKESSGRKSKKDQFPVLEVSSPMVGTSKPKTLTKEEKKAKQKLMKAKDNLFPEGQKVVDDSSSDESMDHDADTEERNKENDSSVSQDMFSQSSNQKKNVNDISESENPSQRIDEYPSQDSSQTSPSLPPPGQGCPGGVSSVGKRALSEGDTNNSIESDLSTQASLLKRQKEHEEQVLWNACSNN